MIEHNGLPAKDIAGLVSGCRFASIRVRRRVAGFRGLVASKLLFDIRSRAPMAVAAPARISPLPPGRPLLIANAFAYTFRFVNHVFEEVAYVVRDVLDRGR